ncbi:MAG: MOSC domain-containing protein [archaeon]
MKGKIHSINISATKGIPKTPVAAADAIAGWGLKDDSHAQPGIRQVSLLAMESIEKQKECAKIKKKDIDLKPGDFAENITTVGIDLKNLPIGTKIKAGDEVILEISKIGKECHIGCAIFQKLGSCIMPKEGIFAKIIKGGTIKKGDTLETIDK